MATIETYDNEGEAIGARDHYNHNLGKRATVCKMPGDNVEDYGGGNQSAIFKEIDPAIWLLVVED